VVCMQLLSTRHKTRSTAPHGASQHGEAVVFLQTWTTPVSGAAEGSSSAV
jgi:hypothetical protein